MSSIRNAVVTLAVLGGACAEADIGGHGDAGDSDATTSADAGSDGDAAGACRPRWRLAIADATVRGVALDGDDLYLAGNGAGTGRVIALATCRGTRRETIPITHPMANETAIDRVLVAAGDVFAVGSAVEAADPREGLYARIDAASLEMVWSQPLFGSGGEDATAAIARAGSGALWMTGAANTAEQSTLWGIKATADGQACGFAGPAPGTFGRAIVARGDDVYMFGDDTTGHTLIAHYSDAACASQGPCACTPDWTQSLAIGATWTVVLDAAVATDALYVAGIARDDDETPTDTFAFASRLDPGTGDALGTLRWNASNLGEAYTAIALDEDAVYVGGGRAWDGDLAFTSVVSTVQRLPRPITDDSAPVWIASPDANLVWAIAAEPPGGDGLYAAGLATPTSGVALRCEKATGCPE